MTRLLQAKIILIILFVGFKGSQTEWIEYQGKEYNFATQAPDMSNTWHSARKWCQENGGDLVSITSDAEYNWIVNQLNLDTYNGAIWIGLNYLDGISWKWSDGELNVPDYWSAGYPEPVPNEHGRSNLCAIQDQNSNTWYNLNCGNSFAFICKRESDSTDPITDPPTPVVGGYCPEGYFTSDVNNNKCYKFVQVDDIDSQGLTHHEAGLECQKGPGLNPDLVSIHSEVENALLVTQIRKKGYGVWIGFNTTNRANWFGWEWTDNSALDFENWAYNYPKYFLGQCAEMGVEDYKAMPGTWNNLECNRKRGYICQTFKDVLIQTPPPNTPNDCRSDYTPFWYGCYKIVKDGLKTWDEASQYCKNEGGDLVSIQTSPENSAIFVKLAELSLDVWIGLRDFKQNGQYSWSDDWSTFYTNWGPDQPIQLENGGCVSMRADGRWYDNVCTNNKPFVCKISSVVPMTYPPDLPGFCPGEEQGDLSWIHFGEFCYLFESYNSKTWSDANKQCHSYSKAAHLVSIHSHVENEFIIKKMKELPRDYGSWIGMFRSKSGRQWHWVDQSPVQYENWAPGEPNGNHTQEDCAEMYINNYPGKWGDLGCNRYSYYICKSPKIPKGFIPPLKNGRCPEGWVPYGSKCYMFEANRAKDWQTALDDCTSQGGSKATLASLHSTLGSEFVHEEMKKRTELPDPLNYWIGLVKDGSMDSGNDFYWMDGSPLDFTAWGFTEPNDRGGNENCVSVYSNTMKWNDIQCDNHRAYVCQVDMGSETGLSTGEIVGIIFGVLAIILLLTAIVFVILDKFQMISLTKASRDTKNHLDDEPLESNA